MTISLPTPHEAACEAGGSAQVRRIAAERARCQILLRLVTAQIDVLTAGATLDGTDTWLALRPVREDAPPLVDLDELLRETDDPDSTWDRVRRLTELQAALRDYLHALDR